MKHLLPIVIPFALLTTALPAAPLQKAEVTRVHNDVKLLPGDGASSAAKPGDIVTGKTAVRTGEKSRAELKFSDATLTRLGANTQFSFESGTRNLSLENGVIFLQVPKGAGGAKIRTAAVTAAITGTTIMIEYVPGKVLKIIVIEGTLDVYFPDRPGVFITLRAGQMIMMRPDARGFPRPVEIDIEKLLLTSELAGAGGGFDIAGGDAVGDALEEQKKQLREGKLIGTNLVIPGRGNQVLVLTGDAALALRSNELFFVPQPTPPGQSPPPPRFVRRPPPPPSNPLNPPPPPPPVKPPPTGGGLLPPDLLSGNWVMDGTMRINPALTGPTIQQPPLAGRGALYNAESVGSLHPWLFDTAETVPGNDLADILDGTGTWSTYLLENLTLAGTPEVVPSGTSNIMLASPNAIASQQGQPNQRGAALTWDLSGAKNWALMTQNNPINLAGWGYNITGTDSNLLLHANGLGGDVTVMSSIQLGEGNLTTLAGGNASYADGISIDTANWRSNSTGNLAIDRTAASAAQTMSLEAGGNVGINHSYLEAGAPADTDNVDVAQITVQDSTQLSTLISGTGTGGNILIRSNNGNVILSGHTTIRASGPGARVDVVALNGRIDATGPDDGDSRINVEATEVVRFEATGGPNPGLLLNEANLSANQIIVQANGANTLLDIINSDFNARTSARIYADGPGSILRFGGYTRLTGDTVRLAGQTVNVTPMGLVDAKAVQNLGIHADQHQYYLNTATGTDYGIILTNPSGNVRQTNYAGRNLPLPPPPPTPPSPTN